MGFDSISSFLSSEGAYFVFSYISLNLRRRRWGGEGKDSLSTAIWDYIGIHIHKNPLNTNGTFPHN